MSKKSNSKKSIQIIRTVELAEMLSISMTTLYNWINAGILPARVRIGSRYVGWRRSDIENFISSQMEPEQESAAA